MTVTEFCERGIKICEVIGWPEWMEDDEVQQVIKLPREWVIRFKFHGEEKWSFDCILHECWAANHLAVHFRKKLSIERYMIVLQYAANNQIHCSVQCPYNEFQGHRYIGEGDEFTALIDAAESLWLKEKKACKK